MTSRVSARHPARADMGRHRTLYIIMRDPASKKTRSGPEHPAEAIGGGNAKSAEVAAQPPLCQTPIYGQRRFGA